MYAFMSVIVLVWLPGNEEDIIWSVLWYVRTYQTTVSTRYALSLSLGVEAVCI